MTKKTKAPAKPVTKATETPADAAHPVETLPLAQLHLSPLNPRQHVSDAEIASLAASIRACGLMQNLAGLIVQDGDNRQQIQIVAGGRRLRALHLIAEQDGTDKQDVPVPVIVTADPAEALTWATTENTARKPLHPAEEIAAYRAMRDVGREVAEIAKVFGVTMRHVKGRLRLADLAPVILEALAGDEITLDVAAAYTVCADPIRQAEVFAALANAWGGDSPHEIKRRLMTDSETGDSRYATLVGRAAYEARGGTVREDLFGEEVFFEDAELLARMAMERLEAIGGDHEIAGWSWVEISLERLSYDATAKMGRTYPTRPEPDDGEAERYDTLADAIEEDTATDAEKAELAALEDKLEREDYTDAQMAHAGVILWVGYHGDIQSEYGLVKPEQMEAAIAAGICRKPYRAGSDAAPKEKPLYSAALAEDLAKVRTGALQTALLAKPELALDLLTFALATPVYSDSLPLQISTTDPANQPKEGEGMSLPDALQEASYGAPLTGDKAAEAFAAFRALTKRERNAILTRNVARIAQAGLGGADANPFVEMLADLAGMKPRKVWTPTTAFFKRLTKDQLLSIHQQIRGLDVPSTQLARQSKKAVADWLDAMFNGGANAPTLTKEERARADAWLPEQMAVEGSDEEGGAMSQQPREAHAREERVSTSSEKAA